MDFRTTILMYSLTSLTTGALLIFLYRVFPNMPGTKYWAAGGMATGFGGVLFVLRGAIPDVYSIAFGNSIIIIGYAFYVIGIRSYLRQKICWQVPIAFALTSCIPFFILYDSQDSLYMRVMVSSFALGTLNLMSVYYLLQRYDHRQFASLLPGVGFLLSGSVLYARLFLFFTGVHDETDYIQTTYFINYLVFVVASLSNILISTGFVLMISSELQERLNVKIENEQKKSEEKSKFLAMLSHELKTPLSVVQMAIGSKSFNQESKNEALNSIDEMVRVLDFVNRLDQMETNALKINSRHFDLENLLEEVVASAGAAGRVKIHGVLAGEVSSDPDLVRIIISNLLDNALKYGKSDREVSIQLSAEFIDGLGEIINISICNVIGESGLPDGKMLFEKYYRSPNAYNYTGSGLGLYISQGLAKMVHGDLVYSPTDTHVCFNLLLPKLT